MTMTNNEQIQKETETISNVIFNFEINSNEDLKTSVELISELKNKQAEVKFTKDEMTKSATETLKRISSFFKNPLDALQEAEHTLKTKIKKYINTNETKRDELLNNMQNMTQEERKNALQKSSELTIPKIDGLSIRESWIGEAENPEILLEWIITHKRFEFLSINQKALETYTRQMKTNPEIPGWRPIKKKTIVISSPKEKK